MTNLSLVPQIHSPETMTSSEISDLIGNDRHNNVKRTIDRLVDRGVISQPQSSERRNGQGQLVIDYVLHKRDTYIVVAQMSPEFTGQLVDRWQQLESHLVNRTLNIQDLSISETSDLMALLIAHEPDQLLAFMRPAVEEMVTQSLSQRAPMEHVSQPIENFEDLFNPSQLGFLSRLSSQRMNRILLDLNFQTRDEFGYTPTRHAEGLYEEVLRRRNRAGRLVVKFLWKRRVLQSIPARYLA